jgi:hypothetical protein
VSLSFLRLKEETDFHLTRDFVSLGSVLVIFARAVRLSHWFRTNLNSNLRKFPALSRAMLTLSVCLKSQTMSPISVLIGVKPICRSNADSPLNITESS